MVRCYVTRSGADDNFGSPCEGGIVHDLEKSGLRNSSYFTDGPPEP